MDLIERYLAVQDRCAAARRPDGLSAKLRGLLIARVEAREAALRRPLQADEAAAELAGFARRLLRESQAVMRRLEDACLGADAAPTNTFEGGSYGPR
jgi:hypothetical protein